MLNQNQHIDLLIIGQGLAGSLLAYEAHLKGLNFVVVDEELSQTSSKVAAGMFCPISGKRMVKSWMVDALLPYMQNTYQALEQLLNQQFLYNQPVYQVFGSIKEQNDLFTRAEDAAFAQFVDFNPQLQKGLVQPFGAFQINSSGWLNTTTFLNAFKQWLVQNNRFISQVFNGNDLFFENEYWHWSGIAAKQIVFCDGYQNSKNSFFDFLPYVLCKGQVVTLKLPFITNVIVKKGVYLVHLGNGTYKAGATYEWHNLLPEPTVDGLLFLKEKLTELVGSEFEIVSHESGIRPTTKDRKPFLGQHTKHKNMFVFGGLGTKGVMQAPFLANHLLNFMLHKTPLLPDTDINRCLKK